jgi:hypothetical protein
MQGTVEDFKHAYHSMSDDALLAINADELVDAARKCYDEELAARSLIPSSLQPAAQPAPPDELVCVAVFNLKRDADLAQSVLESAEIPAFSPTGICWTSIQPSPPPSWAAVRWWCPRPTPKRRAEC